MRTTLLGIVLALTAGTGWGEAAGPSGAGRAPRLQPPQFWVFTFSNFLRDDTTAEKIALVKRAGKAGYTGIVVSDVKFSKFHLQPPHRPVGRAEATLRRRPSPLNCRIRGSGWSTIMYLITGRWWSRGWCCLLAWPYS